MGFDVDIPEPSYVELELEPVKVLHGPFDPHAVRERVYLGHPLVWRLEPDALPEDLRPYAEQNAQHRVFHLMLLEVNFRHDPREPVLLVNLEVMLSAGAHQQGKPAVAIRVSPRGLSTPRVRSSRLAVAADFGVLKPEAERSRQDEAGEPYLRVEGVGTSVVHWEFTRVAPRELADPHQLTLLTDTPRGVPVDAVLSLSATVRRKRAGFVNCTARIPDFLAITPVSG
ncbi:hypothetical protein [Streptomyces griseus]|uniref:hypothetical protein n=1 Tax=Streptomyces griseus TaxID=1911 RepID=UPI00055AEC8A|nr:hypothetical protein [Streptomyces griseus]